MLHLPPKRRGRCTHHDRLVLAAATYANRALPVAVVIARCLAWFGFTERATRAALKRLEAEQALAISDNRVHMTVSNRNRARAAGQRFTFGRRDVERFRAGEIDALQLGLLALLPNRGDGWCDVDEHLARMLGTDRTRLARARQALVDAGDLVSTAEKRLRGGYLARCWRPAPEYATGTQGPDDATGTPQHATGTLSDATGTQSGTPLEASYLWDHRTAAAATAAPPPMAASDPERQHEQQRQKPGTSAPWVAHATAEADVAAALANWSTFEDGLRGAVGRLHLAASSVEGLHLALAAAGVFVMPSPRLSTAGRLGLRRRRMDLAEQLADQGIEPSLVLEAAHLLARRAASPRHVGAMLRRTLEPKGAEFLERRRAGESLPTAAGRDALDRLVQPQRRGIGEFAYPARWWRDAVPQEVLDRLADLRELVAGVAVAWEGRDVAGDLGIERARRALAERGEQQRRDREERARQQAEARARHAEGAERQRRSRIIGAVQAGAWRKIGRLIVDGQTTIAEAASLTGIDASQIAADVDAAFAERAIA
ncbi:MAG: hypothetical protein KDC98_18850 [Planctomycetes bacterium]|nr:hypothetical protein [Planctomycetota bacterium]